MIVCFIALPVVVCPLWACDFGLLWRFGGRVGVGVLNSNCCLVMLVIGGARCNVVFVSC